MNLHKYTLLFTCFLAFTICSSLSPELHAGEKQKTIVFVRYNIKDSDNNSTIVSEFKKAMEERGYQEGKNVRYIDYVTHTARQDAAREVIAIAEKYKEEADMFITSSWTSLYIRSRLAKTDVPQLFVPALQSSAQNMLPFLNDKPGTNLSGVYLMYDPEKILRMTKLILPRTDKYAFVYDSHIPVDMSFKEQFGRLNESDRHGITIYYLDLANGIDAVIRKMKKIGVQVFGGAIGVFANLEDLSQTTLPIITSLLYDRHENTLEKNIAQSNIIAGLYNPFNYCARQAAEMTADIFDGKTTIEETVPRPALQKFFINLKTAKRIGVPVPFTVLEAVDIVIK